MILKLVSKSITNPHYRSLLRSTVFLISDNNQNKGFGKFQRKKNQNSSKEEKVAQQGPGPEENTNKQQTIKEEKKINENNIHNFEHNKKSREQVQGFSNFQRKKKSTTVHQQPSKPTNTVNTTNEKKTNQKPQQSSKNTQKQFRNTETSSLPQGFEKFARKKTNQSILNGSLKTESTQKVAQEKKQQQRQSSQQQSPYNFYNLQKQQQKSPQDQQPMSQTNQKGPHHFKARTPTKNLQTASQNQTPNVQKQSSPQPQYQNAFSKIQNQPIKNQTETKTAQQIAKQRQERQIKEKQQFFTKKVHHFKQKQAQKQRTKQSNKIFQLLKKKIDEFYKLIHQKTGTIQISPPLWVRSNPLFMLLFKIITNKKFLIIAFILFIYANYQQSIQEIPSQQLLDMISSSNAINIEFLEKQYETDAQIGKKIKEYAIIRLMDGRKYKCVSNQEFQNLVKYKVQAINLMRNHQNMVYIIYAKKQSFFESTLKTLRTFLGFAMLYIFFSAIMGTKASRRGAPGAGKSGFGSQQLSKSKRFVQPVNVKFNDVVGMQKAKEEIVQFIDFLKTPQKYHKLGAKIPKGALLTGPPGTGKTMIAKACAGESQVPFFTISGSQFMEMYVGVGAQRVRDLFAQAKKVAPSIIFIDEIDAVGKKRTTGFGGGNDERDTTLNQLLVQMDGFNSDSNVIVFAATNQKDVLDPALTRPGRFDRMIEVDLPDIEGRKQIFMVHLRPIVIDSQSSMQEYAKRMATLTPGFSGADIKNLCNQAAIMAARNGNKFVTMHDFELATQRVIGGVEKKSHLITPQTKKIVAYHECGHGVISWFLQGANPLLKLTIIPRSKGSIGFAQYLPHESQISTKNQLQDQICVILSGRVTEQVFFGKISTGAYDDLQKAYQIAKMIVTKYGMSQKLGWLSFQQSQYAKYYSKQTQKVIDQEILRIISTCTERTRKLVNEKRQLIQKLAAKLLEMETIDLTTINSILGPRPFKPNKQYQEYFNEHRKMAEEGPSSISMKQVKFKDYLV